MPTSMFLTITQAATASSQTNISAVPNTRADQPLYQLGSLLGPSSILPTKQVSESLAEEIHLNRKAGAAILIKNLDSGGIPFATNKFFLTGMQQTYREKAQIMETFDGASVSFFDDAVKVYQLTGVFVEYYDDSTTP
jgi:hypothetical protein